MKRTTETLVLGVGPLSVRESLDVVKFTAAEIATLNKALIIVQQARELIEEENEYSNWAFADTHLSALVEALNGKKGEWPV